MDLQENIKIAAEVYQHLKCYADKGIAEECIDCFNAGALSQAAKDYWYNEFKRERIPIIIDECSYFDTDMVIKLLKQKKKLEFGTGGGPTDEEIELWQKQVVEPGYEEQRIKSDGIIEQSNHVPIHNMSNLPCDLCYLVDGTYEKYERYINDNPDKPISFDNWKYMMDNYNSLLTEGAMEGDIDAQLHQKWINKEDFDAVHGEPPHIANGKRPYYPIGVIQSDPLYGATKKDFDDALIEASSKSTLDNVSIIDHINHGVSVVICGVKEHDMDNVSKMIIKARSKGVNIVFVGYDHPAIVEANKHPFVDMPELPIKSIVPIHDIYPQDHVKWNERYDKPWNTKKEKKVSHKRTNKRK